MNEGRDLYSLEAEQGVIGALMLDKSLVDDIFGTVTTADFYFEDNAALFEEARACHEVGMPIDIVTVGLSRRLLPSGSTTLGYAGDIARCVPSVANWKTYARVIRERAVLRHLVAVSRAIEEGASANRPFPEIIASAQQAMADVRDLEGDEPKYRRLDEWMGDAANTVNDKHLGLISDWPSFGLVDLDELADGIRPKKITIIGGLPGSGKTTLALQAAQHNAIRRNDPWLVFSLEMPGEELGLRAIASLGGIELQRLSKPAGTRGMRDEDWNAMVGAVAQANGAPLFVVEDPVQTPSSIRAEARRCQREHGLGGIVVDYLQLVKAETKGRTRSEEVGAISKAFLRLSKELDIPVVLLSQLNRESTKRTGKKPQSSDLRDSGEVEADASCIILVHRDMDTEEGQNGLTEMLMTKCRHARVGSCIVQQQGQYGRFVNFAGREPSQEEVEIGRPFSDQYKGRKKP
ncbi:AAA family ATPase [Pseudomonas sp. D5002]|uniref:replicative DNA helicase n=1 Tax=Pseudomonas sp. D5002 TaxID=2738818 RepID=UPI0015A3E5EE|nr:DnaB-like helicase C-terminal domain-containing protein [Pseudomonas sp. D5002]NWB08937.1 AAA family ATPase [Pseudomonas sp. D5002]